ncbi:MAG: hypothetical protein ACD_10C00301G0001 [uncultured bacterium]|nr:MAG: hypothetical protein ACD_10C00301G0001 [uncultured bacterium]
MITLGVPVASQAFAASLTIRLLLLAEQAGSKQLGQIEFSQTFLTHQQQRMRQAFASGLKAKPDLFMKINYIHKQVFVTICSSDLRMFSSALLASTSCMREGF